MPTAIPYENLNLLNAPYKQAMLEQLAQMLDDGQFVLGSQVSAFEQEFATFVGAPYCIGVSNGLDALTLSLIALDLAPCSEVLVPANTYIASINAIILAGHIPVLVEPDLLTYNIDPNQIHKHISPNTRAILLVHLYGKCCDMQPILNLAKQYDLYLIEDCAQAHGASYKNQQVGTFGDAAGFSFYPTKNLGALGDAGAVVCKSEKLYHKIAMLRNYGQKIKYVNETIGYNARLDEIQAAFLRLKLKHLKQYNERKKQIATLYFQGLNTQKFILPKQNDNYDDVFHIFAIRHNQRDLLQNHLAKHGITAILHYPIAPADQNALRQYFAKHQLPFDPEQYPIARLIHETELSLPCSVIHSNEQIERVIDVMNGFNP